MYVLSFYLQSEKKNLTLNIIKRNRPLREALDRERPLITDKHTEILDCIPCVMMVLLHSASRAQRSTTPRQTVDLDLQL